MRLQERSKMTEYGIPMRMVSSSCPIPALLHTSSRSRELALRRWKLCFNGPCSRKSRPTNSSTFVDSRNDTLLLFNEWRFLKNFPDHSSLIERSSIENLAMYIDNRSYASDAITMSAVRYYGLLAIFIRQAFPCLKTLSIVVDDLYQFQHLWGTSEERLALMPMQNWGLGGIRELGVTGDIEKIYETVGWESVEFRFVTLVGKDVKKLLNGE